MPDISLLPLLAGVAALLLSLRLLRLLLTGWQHFDAGRSTLDRLSVDLYRGCRELVGSLLGGHDDVGERACAALSCATVRHRETAGATRAGTVEDVESLEATDLEIFDVLRVGNITDANLPAYFGLGRCLNLERNLRKDRT